MTRTYAFPPGGLPAQTEEPAQSGAIFTGAVSGGGVMFDRTSLFRLGGHGAGSVIRYPALPKPPNMASDPRRRIHRARSRSGARLRS